VWAPFAQIHSFIDLNENCLLSYKMILRQFQILGRFYNELFSSNSQLCELLSLLTMANTAALMMQFHLFPVVLFTLLAASYLHVSELFLFSLPVLFR